MALLGQNRDVGVESTYFAIFLMDSLKSFVSGVFRELSNIRKFVA